MTRFKLRTLVSDSIEKACARPFLLSEDEALALRAVRQMIENDDGACDQILSMVEQKKTGEQKQ